MQTVWVDEKRVIEDFRSRTRRSAELFRRAISVTPGGVMAGIKFFEPYPIFIQKAEGSHVWDVDGNESVDYLMSYGALILGHGHPVVRSSIQSALDKYGTTVTGTPSEAESEYGQMLLDLYHKDGLLRFTNSGLEATLLSVRLARAFTGKRKIAKFEGHYHGAVDRLLFSYAPDAASAGVAKAPLPVADSADVNESILSEALTLPFNDWAATERLLSDHVNELACVIMEPFEEGVIAAEPAFMTNLRSLTKDLGVPLIFDEVKTGFRVRLGGATEFYGVTPDLACLGKIIGGGLPIGAVAGDRGLMEQLDPRSERSRRVFHSGTFNGNPLSLSAGKATIEEISRPGKLRDLGSVTERLKAAISSALHARQIPHFMAGEGAMFNIYITDKQVRNYRDARASDLRLRRFLDIGQITNGIYLKPENRYCLSTAHTDDDVSLTREKFDLALDVVVPGKFS